MTEDEELAPMVFNEEVEDEVAPNPQVAVESLQTQTRGESKTTRSNPNRNGSHVLQEILTAQKDSRTGP